MDYSHIVMAFQLAYLIMMPVMGRIIDWLGLRLGFTISIITWSIAQMITALATGWRSFAVFRSMLGITEAAISPAVRRPSLNGSGRRKELLQRDLQWARVLER